MIDDVPCVLFLLSSPDVFVLSMCLSQEVVPILLPLEILGDQVYSASVGAVVVVMVIPREVGNCFGLERWYGVV